eukprot:c44151_g1_i1 orf=100-264(+)
MGVLNCLASKPIFHNNRKCSLSTFTNNLIHVIAIYNYPLKGIHIGCLSGLFGHV